MNLAFSTLGCPNWEIDQMLAAACASGYQGVELRFYAGSRDLLTTLPDFPGGVSAFRRRFDDAGVKICCLDSSVVLSLPETDLAAGQLWIDLARALGAPYVRVFGGDQPDGVSAEDWLKAAGEKLGAMGERAAEHGLRILVETHDGFCSSSLTARLLEAAGDTGTGVIWDLFHPWRTGETPSETLAAIGRITHHVHVKDGFAQEELTLLGEGKAPLRELLTKLHEIGYDGFLSFEWEKAWYPDLPDPEIAFPHGAQYLRGLLRELGIPLG